MAKWATPRRALHLLNGPCSAGARVGGLSHRALAPRNTARCIAHGSADLDWDSLLFNYMPTNCHIEYSWKDGEWSEGKIMDSPMVEMHILSSVLHYGQALFEGLKVFSRADGTVAMYQPFMGNVDRMARGCDRLGMPTVDADMFNGAIERVVMENLEFIPPYGNNGALYVRPFIFGCGPKLGLGMAPEYKFIVTVNPVGDYYSGGLSALDGMVQTEYDRAAGKGIGGVKAGGNYAADVVPSAQAAAAGYPIALYLDATEHKYVEEFSTSNFIAVDKEGNYVTPQSDSILKSVTNMSLRQIATDLGMGVQERPVEYSEVGDFAEVAACGTAVVLTPIKSLTHGSEKVEFGGFEKFQAMYDRVRAIQNGEYEDKHGWMIQIGDN